MRGRILLAGFGTLLSIAACRSMPVSRGLCVDPPDLEAIKSRAINISNDENLRPDWTPIADESVEFESGKSYVSYLAFFDAPPVGHVLIYMNCGGEPIKVIATEWGTL